MKDIAFIYFTGTGNTRLVSEVLANELERAGCTVTFFGVEDLLHDENLCNDLVHYDLLGIGYPVYDLLPPGLLVRMIESLPDNPERKPIFLFSTYATLKGDCDSHTLRLLSGKGYPVIARQGFKCPSSGVALYEKPGHLRYRTLHFEKNIDARIKKFAKTVLTGLDSYILKPFALSGVVMPFWNLIRLFSVKLYCDKYYRNLTVSGECSGCGVCVGNCPMGNLVPDDKRIRVVDGDGCLRCLRCITRCPQKAINFTSSGRQGDYTIAIRNRLYLEACRTK
jgi:ferredoxin